MYRFPILASAILMSGIVACSSAGGDPAEGSGNTGNNGSGNTGNNGSSGSGFGVGGANGFGGQSFGTGGNSAGACDAALPVTYRDFKGGGEPGGHPDFEITARGVKQSDGQTFKGWNDIGCGLVQDALGPDNKPLFYAGLADSANGIMVPVGAGKRQRTVSGPGCWTAANPTPTGVCYVGTCAPWTITPLTYVIKDATTFGTWYNTTEGTNMEIKKTLPLTETPPGSGTFVFDTNAFFPIDGEGFGNTPGQTHNFHFTTEASVMFRYLEKQKFTFRGDDDLWIFVNGKLALDVGGSHQALEGTIDFDKQATALGITVGSRYRMDIFHAERQTTESNFRIETNISCFEPVVVE